MDSRSLRGTRPRIIGRRDTSRYERASFNARQPHVIASAFVLVSTKVRWLTSGLVLERPKRLSLQK